MLLPHNPPDFVNFLLTLSRAGAIPSHWSQPRASALITVSNISVPEILKVVPVTHCSPCTGSSLTVWSKTQGICLLSFILLIV